MNPQPQIDLSNPRNLSGIYFRHQVNNEWKNICFEELPRDEQLKILESKNKEWLISLILSLSDELVELGNFTNVAK